MTTDPINTARIRATQPCAAHYAARRVLDAAGNRASEGLRVVEDFVRFALDDRHLTSLTKTMRHELAAAIQEFDHDGLLAARETLADVGSEITTAAERQRDDLDAIVAAAFKRLQQSLRSLEEYSKLLNRAISPRFETLRYRSYTLERAVHITSRSGERLRPARLYVLVDGRANEAEFRQLVQSLVDAEVHILQLRDKSLDDRSLLQRAVALRELTRNTNTLAIVNDRPDIAALSQADGVHVGQEELPVKHARAIIGPKGLIGVSTHSIEQARQAVLDGADYLGVGPTFPSTTKSFAAFPGLPLVRQVADEISLPAFVIGGVTLERLPQLLAAGIGRIAVGAAIAEAADPAGAARQFLAALNAAHDAESSHAERTEAIQLGATGR